MPALKITEQVAEDIRSRMKSFDFEAIHKSRKAREESGTFDVIISTEDVDRAGEIVRQNGWDLANYKNNPIVLWAHDYYSLPVGVCTETYETTVRGVPALGARGVFLSADINPFAQQVRKLYEFGLKQGQGVGCTTSVGFIPKEFDANQHDVITKAELLEFSFVPVPANQGVGPAQGRSLTFAEARELGLDIVVMHAKGVRFAELRGYIPADISETKAEDNTKWAKPKLEDFTKKAWADLTLEEKAHITSHFAYSKDAPAASFDDLKLPYRRATDGAIIFNGLKAAMNDLIGSRGGVVEGDQKAVYEHLAKHYTLFGKKAPEFATLKEAQVGDHCQMDDGAPGILAADPHDPDGPLVCYPQEQDKSAEELHASQKELLKAVGDEHARHAYEVGKSFDEFQKAVAEDQGDPVDANEHVKDLRSSLQDEHNMHRAKSVALFRAFDPSENKAFDKNEHLESLRAEHDDYEQKSMKSFDRFEEKATKGVQDGPSDEHIDWIIGKMEDAQYVHKKAVTKIAKAMCKAAYGDGDEPNEKTLEILKEILAPHIDEQLLPAVIGKIGTRLATEDHKRLGEAHQHLKTASAVLEALAKGLADGNEEESRSNVVPKNDDEGSRENRSKSRAPSHSDPALKAHIQAREVLREVEATVREGLKNFNFEIRASSKK